MNSMYLALGYKCNHHCFFCPCGNRDVKAPAASTADLIRAIEKGIAKEQITHITLSGGEPTLHPGFHEILNYCLTHHLITGVLSNGDTFHSPKNIHRFFDQLPPGQLHITTALHSHIPEIHNMITGKDDSFQHTVKGIQNIIDTGIPITLKQVISSRNYQALPELIQFAFETFGPKISLTLCGMDYCGMTPEMIRQYAVSFPDLSQSLEKALDVVTDLRRQYSAFPIVTVTDLPLCCVDPYYWGYFVKVSRSTLSMYSAPEDRSGNVQSDTEVLNDCNTFFDECRRCSVEELCPGVWRTASQILGESSVRAIRPCSG